MTKRIPQQDGQVPNSILSLGPTEGMLLCESANIKTKKNALMRQALSPILQNSSKVLGLIFAVQEVVQKHNQFFWTASRVNHYECVHVVPRNFTGEQPFELCKCFSVILAGNGVITSFSGPLRL